MWNTVLHIVPVLNNIAEAVGQEMDMTGDLSYIFFTTLYICHIWIHTTFTTVQCMKENNHNPLISLRDSGFMINVPPSFINI